MLTLRRSLIPRGFAAAALAAGAVAAPPFAVTASAAPSGPMPPTEIAQDVTLSQAGQAGLVKLTAKGGYGGDVMAVDLDGARIPGAPVTVRVRIEFHGAQKNGQPWPQAKGDAIAAAIEGRLGGLKGADGTPVTVDVIPIVRADSQPATAGYHQIELQDFVSGSEVNFIGGEVLPGDIHTGVFGTNEPPTTYAHETLHILGFKDRYLAREPDALIDGKRYPLPKFKGDINNKAEADAWFDKVTKAEKALEAKLGKKSKLVPGIPKGHEKDLLANTQDNVATLPTADVDALIARAGVHLTAKPGDVLLSKDPAQQNLGVGASLDLFAPRGGNAHADGIWAYCLDLARKTPALGQGFDILGPAAGAGGPQMATLQRLLERIGSDPEAYGFRGPTGAQFAVWSVTDGDPPNASGQAMLAAAGIGFDETLFKASPHFTSPNAGQPGTAAVTTTGVLPGIPVDRTPPPAGPIDTTPVAKPVALVLRAPKRLTLRRKGATTLRIPVVLIGAPDHVTLTLRRVGSKVAAPVGVEAVPLGPSTLRLPLPKLRGGKYRLKVSGAGGWYRTSTLRIDRPANRRR